MTDRLDEAYDSGHKNARNIYLRRPGFPDEHVAVVFDPAAGPRFVAALNGSISPEFAYALELLNSLTDTDPCSFDHNHSCQAHYYFYLDQGEKCPVQAAKDLLKKYGYDKEDK